MATKRAKTFSDEMFNLLLEHIRKTSLLPERDRLMVCLSFKAGLRVGEIAKIKLSHMLTAQRKPSKFIHIYSDVGKMNRERDIPMHPMVKEALEAFMKRHPTAEHVAISSQQFRWSLARGEPIHPNTRYKPMSLTAVRNYYWRLLQQLGFEGVSTHSGRRTFGTKAARLANLNHCSIRDVQKLLGHASLETTEDYIELSDDATKLVAAL